MSITIKQLVQREVIYCVSQLISELSKKASDHGDWDIELINIHQGPHDDEGWSLDVLEHWIVSDWLADKLIAKGETVNKDFMGLVIWGRTTSGQHISQDYVIQQIYQEEM